MRERDYMAITCHEIRNPLNGTVRHAQPPRSPHAPPRPATAQRPLRIHPSAQRPASPWAAGQPAARARTWHVHSISLSMNMAHATQVGNLQLAQKALQTVATAEGRSPAEAEALRDATALLAPPRKPAALCTPAAASCAQAATLCTQAAALRTKMQPRAPRLRPCAPRLRPHVS